MFTSNNENGFTIKLKHIKILDFIICGCGFYTKISRMVIFGLIFALFFWYFNCIFRLHRLLKTVRETLRDIVPVVLFATLFPIKSLVASAVFCNYFFFGGVLSASVPDVLVLL